jgi:hypothetical protein
VQAAPAPGAPLQATLNTTVDLVRHTVGEASTLLTATVALFNAAPSAAVLAANNARRWPTRRLAVGPPRSMRWENGSMFGLVQEFASHALVMAGAPPSEWLAGPSQPSWRFVMDNAFTLCDALFAADNTYIEHAFEAAHVDVIILSCLQAAFLAVAAFLLAGVFMPSVHAVQHFNRGIMDVAAALPRSSLRKLADRYRAACDRMDGVLASIAAAEAAEGENDVANEDDLGTSDDSDDSDGASVHSDSAAEGSEEEGGGATAVPPAQPAAAMVPPLPMASVHPSSFHDTSSAMPTASNAAAAATGIATMRGTANNTLAVGTTLEAADGAIPGQVPAHLTSPAPLTAAGGALSGALTAANAAAKLAGGAASRLRSQARGSASRRVAPAPAPAVGGFPAHLVTQRDLARTGSDGVPPTDSSSVSAACHNGVAWLRRACRAVTCIGLSYSLRLLVARVAVAMLLVSGLVSAGYGLSVAALQFNAYRGAALDATNHRRFLARSVGLLSRELVVGDHQLGDNTELVARLRDTLIEYELVHQALLLGNESMHLHGIRETVVGSGALGVIDARQLDALFVVTADAAHAQDLAGGNVTGGKATDSGLIASSRRLNLEGVHTLFVSAAEDLMARFEPWFGQAHGDHRGNASASTFNATLAGVTGAGRWTSDAQLRTLLHLLEDSLEPLLDGVAHVLADIIHSEDARVITLEAVFFAVQIALFALLQCECRRWGKGGGGGGEGGGVVVRLARDPTLRLAAVLRLNVPTHGYRGRCNTPPSAAASKPATAPLCTHPCVPQLDLLYCFSTPPPPPVHQALPRLHSSQCLRRPRPPRHSPVTPLPSVVSAMRHPPPSCPLPRPSSAFRSAHRATPLAVVVLGTTPSIPLPSPTHAVVVFRRQFAQLEEEAKRTESFVALVPAEVVESAPRLRLLLAAQGYTSAAGGSAGGLVGVAGAGAGGQTLTHVASARAGALSSRGGGGSSGLGRLRAAGTTGRRSARVDSSGAAGSAWRSSASTTAGGVGPIVAPPLQAEMLTAAAGAR